MMTKILLVLATSNIQIKCQVSCDGKRKEEGSKYLEPTVGKE